MMEIISPVMWLAFLVWLLNLGTVFFVGSMGMLNAAPSNEEPSRLSLYIAYSILILSIPIMINVYLQLVYFLTNRNVNWKYKVRWLGSFLLVTFALVFFIKQKYEISSIAFPEEILNKVLWLASVTVFLLPSCVVISASILLIGWRALQAIGYFLRYIFLSLNNPLPIRDIKKAVIEPTKSNGVNWRLIDLPMEDILVLRDWARDNLGSTEKKTIPLAILLTALSLFANNPKFQNSIENFVSFILFLKLDFKSGFNWGQYMLSSIALLFVGILIISFVLLVLEANIVT
jgi:hypothetical protein